MKRIRCQKCKKLKYSENLVKHPNGLVCTPCLIELFANRDYLLAVGLPMVIRK